MKNFKLKRRILKEIDKKSLYEEAARWSVNNLRSRKIDKYSNEYAIIFGKTVTVYTRGYRKAYLARRLQEELNV